MKEMPKCWIKNWMQEMDLLLPDTNHSDDSEPDYGSDFDDIEWLPQNLIVLFNQVIIVFFKVHFNQLHKVITVIKGQ